MINAHITIEEYNSVPSNVDETENILAYFTLKYLIHRNLPCGDPIRRSTFDLSQDYENALDEVDGDIDALAYELNDFYLRELGRPEAPVEGKVSKTAEGHIEGFGYEFYRQYSSSEITIARIKDNSNKEKLCDVIMRRQRAARSYLDEIHVSIIRTEFLENNMSDYPFNDSFYSVLLNIIEAPYIIDYAENRFCCKDCDYFQDLSEEFYIAEEEDRYYCGITEKNLRHDGSCKCCRYFR